MSVRARTRVLRLIGGIFFAFMAASVCVWGSNGYSYSRPIVINHSQVPNTDQANFPLLFSGTYTFLATTGNGGQVTNANGYDIIFSTDPAGNSTLPFEQESYNAATGMLAGFAPTGTAGNFRRSV